MAIEKMNQAEKSKSRPRGAERLADDAERLADETMERVTGGELPPPFPDTVDVSTDIYTQSFKSIK